MPAHRTVNRLSIATAAYIAGIVDGEGTVTLSRLHRGESRRLVVCVSNDELAILKFLHMSLGVGRTTSKRLYREHHRPAFAYQVSGRQALELLRQIAPYMMSYKVLRARLALKRYVEVTPRNGRYTMTVRAARADFETAFFAIRP